MADPEAIEALREALLLDGEPAVRAAAAEFLAKTWDEAAVEPLARAPFTGSLGQCARSGGDRAGCDLERSRKLGRKLRW